MGQFFPVTVYDGQGNIKRVISVEELVSKHWKKLERLTRPQWLKAGRAERNAKYRRWQENKNNPALSTIDEHSLRNGEE